MSQMSESAVHEKPKDEATAEERSESLFDEGFALGDENGEMEEQGERQEEVYQENLEQPKAVEAPSASMPMPVYAAQESPHAVPQEAATAVPASTTTTPKIVDVPDELAEELESLKKLNPDAAALALEDSPEGASIRARLEQYGAELAQDRAERVLWERSQEQQFQQVEAARMEKAREAHNKAFLSTMQRDHPEYTAMILDAARKAEAAQYQQSVFDWISAKPYAEASHLMEVAKSGRDPAQVSALLTQFERERRGQAKRPDPTGALAVPGRGAPVAPAGVGDKDSFDAGWNLNPSK